MNAERWQQVRRLFEQVSEVPVAERPAVLDRVCAGDRELRDEVESLLSAERRAVGLLEGADLARVTLDALDSADSGRELGAYRLQEKIGEGGMSVVYRAARADDEYRQRVAIKVQRRGLGGEHLRLRFRRERQILARLEHPGIARLLDGGTTDDDRTYVVMEYVEGIPIDEYCDRHSFSIDARLELFRRVCGAVQYAHQNLIVHRDLKPGNILVTSDGSPKLLDFGIAKLLGPERGLDGPETTMAGLRLMTPSHASPEQARGGLITTASDVYSLGVLLYGLLSGRRPYRLQGCSAAEVERLLQEIEPPLSSVALCGSLGSHLSGGSPAATPEQISAARGLRPESLRRRLRGDLDTIVAKAMHKDAARRYSSASGLAEDLRSHLAGRPVSARPDSIVYRGGKFLHRHWLSVTVVAVIVGLAVSFAVTASTQAKLVAAERDRVEEERDKNAEVLAFLKEIFATASPEISGGEDVTAREILDWGVQRIAGQLVDQPATRATLLLTLGDVNLSLGRYEVAEDLFRQAVEISRQQPEVDQVALAESLNQLGRAQLKGGAPVQAEEHFSEALQLARREALELAHRGAGAGHLSVAESLRGLGEAALAQGDYAASERLYHQALWVEESFPQGERLSYAETLVGLAKVDLERGDYDSAQGHLERALAIERRILDPRHPRIPIRLQRLMLVLFHLDDFDRAEVVGREALALQERLLGEDHPDLHLTVDSLARVALAQRDFDRAERLSRRAVKIGRQAFGESDPRFAHSLNNLGDGLRKAGDLPAAEQVTREALAIHRRNADGDPSDLASSISNVAVLLHDQGKVDEAAALFLEALEMMRRALEPGHHALAFPLVRLGRILCEGGSAEDAEPLLREALEVRRKALPENHRLTAVAAGWLGVALLQLGRYAEAEPLLLEAHSAYGGFEAVDTSRVGVWRQRLAELYRAWGRPQEAARYSEASTLAPPA